MIGEHRRWLGAGALSAVLALASGCSDAKSLGYDFQFSRGPQGWEELFADYPAGQDAAFDLVAGHRPLPAPLDTSRDALYIAGRNVSDDLWMQFKTEVALPPDTSYRVTFRVEIATDVPGGCGGVGGSPGEDVTVKAGVSLIEPAREPDSIGWWRLNIDKGQQTQGGEDMVVIGDLANSRDCDQGFEWERKPLSGPPMMFTTDSTGRAWLSVGTDSGFEARSAVYYTQFVALFKPI
jgi:hypothetical protein